MPLTFIDLIQEVEDQLRVSSEERTKVRRWLNWAQRAVARAHPWSFLECHARTPTTTDVPNIYTLPDGFMQPRMVRIEDSSGNFTVLTVVHLEHDRANFPDHTSQATVPERCIFTGRTLILRPGANNTTGFIHLDYLETPPKMTGDGNIPLIPDIFRDALVTGAIWIGSRWLFQDKGDQDRNKASFKEAIFDLLTAEKGENPQTTVLSGLDSGWADLLRDSGNAAQF